MPDNQCTTTLSIDSTPLLLSAWSVTTKLSEKITYWNSRPYTDTPKSKWESHNVAVSRRAAKLRTDVAAMERTCARLEVLAGA